MVAQDHPQETLVSWSPTGDALVPWRAQVAGQRWRVRLKDFPEEHLFTLLIGRREVESFDSWPPVWRKLQSSGGRSNGKTAAPSRRPEPRRVVSTSRKSGS